MKSIILRCMSKDTPMLQPERIEKLMNRRGWDVGILAYRSGVKSNTIYKYLQGTRKVQSTLTNLVFLARALGCSVEYLIGMTDIESPTVIMNLSPAQEETVHKIGELSPRRQRELAAYLRLLLDMDTQDREWIKRNLDTNKKLLDFINFMGGEDAFFDLLNSLGQQRETDSGVKGEENNPDNTDNTDETDESGDDESED